MMGRRVVVTGMGAITPVGKDVDSTWHALVRGQSRVACAGLIAIDTGAKGPNFAVASACATAGHAIGEAAEIIRRGDAEVMICGGSEAPITRIGLAAFDSMRALSRRNDEPKRASRPFDRER